ncbi:GDP-L-fucose synthase [Helicobacter sp. MIT 05-5293]|uniref:GDP-L-fucose synthase family protein n=1 Tax=Helicobacter sp. MIT 05-5293 TaxID=1548149 RepID=UPI00051D14A5|nr:GDP-L-fucose synthase [Helicobacter sp. MIT 05-5293]TLD82253.1 GDP-L-fucose synthase [Helicobacter sp. MIT 05-5293]
MEKILITGGKTGMVGRNIAKHPKSKDYQILTPSKEELNLLDKKQIMDYLQFHKPDIVIHCAGLVGGIAANIANPVGFLVQNAYMGLNLISASRENGVTKLLNMASSCMYPKNAPNPLKEEVILTGALEPTNEGYALAKILSTRLCEYISKSCSLLYKTAIPCNLYGKYDKFDDKAHMIPAVIAKLHHAKVNGLKAIDIWGDGEARREFMYAQDLADFAYFALEHLEIMPQNLNVGIGKDFSIKEYYQEIAKVVGFDGEFVYDLSKPVGMQQKLIDDTRLKVFGWEAKTDLTEGISKTYQYYLTLKEQ